MQKKKPSSFTLVSQFQVFEPDCGWLLRHQCDRRSLLQEPAKQFVLATDGAKEISSSSTSASSQPTVKLSFKASAELLFFMHAFLVSDAYAHTHSMRYKAFPFLVIQLKRTLRMIFQVVSVHRKHGSKAPATLGFASLIGRSVENGIQPSRWTDEIF